LTVIEGVRITGVVLAGGQGRRMGGVDKGLQSIAGQPLVKWVLSRFAPQVDEVLINANQNMSVYEGFGYRVIPDAVAGFAGPLAGLERALAMAAHDLVVTAPCDSPLLPADLVVRLYTGLRDRGAELAVARTGAQAHPVFCLCRRALHANLSTFLARGGRKIDAWYASFKVIEIAFDDNPDAFSNINTAEELRAHEASPHFSQRS
jgi:molybdopterin-guanine dinucleotide biosynthesis protein A